MWGIKSFWVCLLALANVFLSCRGSDDVGQEANRADPSKRRRFLDGIKLCGGERDEVAPDGSTPLKVKHVKPFQIEKCAVSNEQFKIFVEDVERTTGKPYQTDADKFGWSFVLDSTLSKEQLDFADSDEGMGEFKTPPTGSQGPESQLETS
ncbi:unnamed protein product [Heterosigma akashiwo]